MSQLNSIHFSFSPFFLLTLSIQCLLTATNCYYVLSRNEKLLNDPVRLRQISERIPAGRWGDPSDFAGPVIFLASAASQYVCGELLVVDGVSKNRNTRSLIFPPLAYKRVTFLLGMDGSLIFSKLDIMCFGREVAKEINVYVCGY